MSVIAFESKSSGGMLDRITKVHPFCKIRLLHHPQSIRPGKRRFPGAARM